MARPESRFAVSNTEIDRAIDRLIKVASQYPNNSLAKAIDDARVIVRKQELYINEMASVIEELQGEKECQR